MKEKLNMDNCKEIESILEKNKIINVNDKVILTNYEISILKNYEIDYNSCPDMKSLIHLIDSNISADDEELEDVLTNISERNYYMETRK